MTIDPFAAPALSPDAAFSLLVPPLQAAGATAAVLAVSGGPDSLALLAFAGENRVRFAALGIAFHVVTVDHGLRPESAAEARFVSEAAARYGLIHETRRCDLSGVRGNLQAAAREARYELLIDAARSCGAAAVLIAHHQDDQIETHLMAAERGASGPALAGMRARRDLAPGLVLLRPFLQTPRAVLAASLAGRGLAGIEDPSNADLRFRRARLRAEIAAGGFDRPRALAALAVAGTERDARDRRLAEALAPGSGFLHFGVSGEGVIGVAEKSFRDLPADVATLFLARAITAAGGGLHPPARSDVERLAGRFAAAGPGFAATLGGCRTSFDGRTLRLEREFGRSGPAPVAVDPARRNAMFDRRFDIRLSPDQALEDRRLVAFGSLERGNALERTLPVLVEADGSPVAAHPALSAKVPGALLAAAQRVRWRLLADLAMPARSG